jgi:hypothetical protein
MALGTGCLALSSVFSQVASATDLLDDPSTSITASNSQVEMGRLSRNGVQQTWDPATSGETSYSGEINAGSSYNYVEFEFTPAEIGNGKYIQIDISEPLAADLFASAWTSYNGSASVASGFDWLGDEGQSEDYAFGSIPPTPQDPHFFNVTVPAGDSLFVVVNTTSAAALGEDFGIQVESFSTKQYDNGTPLPPVPEPTTWALLGAGVMVVGASVYRRRQAAV